MTALARSTDPDTSHEAAAAVYAPTIVQQRVHMVIAINGPVSDEEISWWFGSYAVDCDWVIPTDQSLRTRRSELVDAGLVEYAGIDGITRTGRRTRKWVCS